MMTSVDYMPKWKDAFRLAGFDVWPGAQAIVRSMVGRQLRRVGKFPQMFYNLCVIARKPGNRPDKFIAQLTEGYEFLACNYPRRIGVIDKVPIPESILVDPDTEKAVRTCEKT